MAVGSTRKTEDIMEFSEFKLSKALLKAVASQQYRTPTPIQAAAIPRILDGRDLLGVAQTGTGKTAAFALPILHELGANRRSHSPRSPRVLVLAPTRELVSQIAFCFEAYGRRMNLRVATMYGGVGQNSQVQALKRGVHVLVATPGRLIDLLGQGHVDLDSLKVFVLDEADRMLDLGFGPELRQIIARLPSDRQSLFFSATMPPEIQELADSLLHKPVRVDVTPADSDKAILEAIDQRVLFVEFDKKQMLLSHLLKHQAGDRVLVFTRTKHGARRLSKTLKDEGFEADAIHGDRPQATRTKVLKAFRGGLIRVLIATDVAARGIDVDRISHVINFDLPNDPDMYVHRIGRTGRAGARGVALSFCTLEDLGKFRAIEAAIQQAVEFDANHPFHVPGLTTASIPDDLVKD